MRPSLQRSQETLLRGGRKNLRPRRQFEEELLEDFKVELGVDVIEKKERRLVEAAPEERQFRELQEEHDHLLLAPRKHLGGRPSVDRELEQVALWSDQRHPRTELIATDA